MNADGELIVCDVAILAFYRTITGKKGNCCAGNMRTTMYNYAELIEVPEEKQNFLQKKLGMPKKVLSILVPIYQLS